MNAAQIAKTSTKELIALYNEITGKNITKFSSRAAGEAQVAKAIAAQDAVRKPGKPAPVVAVTEEKAQPKADAPVEPKHNAKGDKIASTGAHSAARSAGVAASWQNAAVRAARSTHNAVKVLRNDTGAEVGSFRSVRQAFVALGLPDSKHIKFRGELKAEGKKAIDVYTFLLQD